MARINARTLRTTAVVTVASAAAVAGLIGVAGAVGSTGAAHPNVVGYGYGYDPSGNFGYGYNYSDTPPTTAPTSGPTSSASPTGSASPTATANPAAGLQVSLHISKTFVTLGTNVTLTGTVTRNGVVVPNVPVTITERYSDGKLVPLGIYTTDAQGNYSHTIRPLYIGNITAAAFGVNSNTVPSRVIVTYREVRYTRTGDVVKLFAQTRPGFITGPNRAERVQLLLTDSSGRQLKVLQTANANQRVLFSGEAQGINQVNFKPQNLGHGTHYLVVKVIGQPVNTGAPTKPIKFVTP